MLSLLLLVLVVVLLFIFVFEPQQKRIKELNEKITETQELVDSVKIKINELPILKSSVEELSGLLDEGYSTYLRGFYSADAITLIDHFIDQNNGEIAALSFEEGVQSGTFDTNFELPDGYNVLNAIIVYEGDYIDFLEFLDYFYEFENVVFISKLSISLNYETNEVLSSAILSFIIIDNELVTETDLFEWEEHTNEVENPFDVITKDIHIDNYEYLR
jgi:hypothetical protein